MTVSHPEYVEALARQLAGQLDAEALVLRQGQARLAALAEALAGNDQQIIERLLNEADREIASGGPAQRAPAETIRRLAEALDCLGEPPTLSRVIDRLPSSCRPAVAMARDGVLRQARGLRRQYRQTAALLAECVRVNGALIESLFRRGPAVTTYDAEGPSQWRADGGLVDQER
jgi:uncharacterized protein YhaN